MLEDSWTPAQKFNQVESSEIPDFYPDQEFAGGNDNVTHSTPDTTYVVSYLPRTANTESKTITQTVKYEYVDGITANRPALPETNQQ